MLVLITAFSIVGISIEQVHVLDGAINEEMESFIHNETRKVAESVYLMCRSVQQLQDEALERNLGVATKLLREQGGMIFGQDEVAWRAVNQFDKSVREVTSAQGAGRRALAWQKCGYYAQIAGRRSGAGNVGSDLHPVSENERVRRHVAGGHQRPQR